MSQFWIAANGRSGTLWLATTLNYSLTHTVRHEEAENNHNNDFYYSPFPIHRWYHKPNYGECHGFLRRYLSPNYPGLERLIPNRFILLRNKKDIIRSWMNRENVQEFELSWIVFQVCKIEKFLLDYQKSDKECEILLFEELITFKLQKLVDKLELKFTVTEEMRTRKLNETKEYKWDWSVQSLKVYDIMSEKHGDKGGY